VGYAIPELYGNFIKTLREKVPNSDKAIWSVHCHNDLGMAVANSLAGVKIGGARQVECTINGLGERAGNCSLEEIVMAVRTRRDYFGLDVGVDTTQIVPASRMVSQTTGFVVQPNKAVVGANAFAHASGIHQDGVLKARDTYEIMRAEDVGWSANKIVLGKLSGRNAFKQRLQDLGIEMESEAKSTPPLPSSRNWPTARARSSTKTSWRWCSDESVTPRRSSTAWCRCRSTAKPASGPHAEVVFTIDGKEYSGRVRRQRSGGCVAQGHRKPRQERRRTGAVFGQCHHQRLHRKPGRGHGAPAARWPGGQRRGCRPGHRGGVGQGLPERAEQAAQQGRSGGGTRFSGVH
jgi:2-isopropylmalate synthase